jgi:monomeric isocitrate dehydrogenase
MGSVPNVGLMAQKQKNMAHTINFPNDWKRRGARCGYTKGTILMEQAVEAIFLECVKLRMLLFKTG